MNKLEEYLDDVKGMDRIELILDLLVDGKITKAQAVVLIANDKMIKDEEEEVSMGAPYWVNTPYVGSSTVLSSPYNPHIQTTTTGTVGYNPITTITTTQ